MTPSTEAGQALTNRLDAYFPPMEYDSWADWIADIEAEARAQAVPSVERIAAASTKVRLEHPASNGTYIGEPYYCQCGEVSRGNEARDLHLAAALHAALVTPSDEETNAVRD